MTEAGPYDRHYAYPLVTWGSTFLGAVVALITAFMLNLLGAALGVAVLAFGPTASGAATAGIVGIAWVAIANLIALGFGAWVAGRSTANPDHHGGTLQGIAVWAVTSFAVLFILSSTLAGVGGAAMQSSDDSAAATASAQSGASALSGATRAAPSAPDAAAVQSAASQVAGATASAAFGTFLAMAFGLVAAIVGARLGARHPNWADRPRYTYVERRH